LGRIFGLKEKFLKNFLLIIAFFRLLAILSLSLWAETVEEVP
jgi:hypothetical protein